MKRKFLEDLGLEKDAIDTILDEVHREGASVKAKADDLKAEVDDLKTQIKDRDKQLDELKKLDPEGLKDQITKLQEANEKAKSDYEAKLAQTVIDNEIERELLKAGAKNIKAVKALLDLSKVQRNGENVKGHVEQIKALLEAEDSKFLFNSTVGTTFKGTKPGEGKDKDKGTSITREQFKRMGYKERTDLYNNDRELYDTLSSED